MCSVPSNSSNPWTITHQAPLLMNSPGKNTGVGGHCLLQGIFLTQGSNPGLLHLLHWQADFLPFTMGEDPLAYMPRSNVGVDGRGRSNPCGPTNGIALVIPSERRDKTLKTLKVYKDPPCSTCHLPRNSYSPSPPASASVWRPCC